MYLFSEVLRFNIDLTFLLFLIQIISKIWSKIAKLQNIKNELTILLLNIIFKSEKYKKILVYLTIKKNICIKVVI